jgi:Cu+-exporting ATPase
MSAAPPPAQTLDLPISGMSCAACATRIERVLNRIARRQRQRQPGDRARMHVARSRARKRLLGQVVAAIEQAGFAVPLQTIEMAIRRHELCRLLDEAWKRYSTACRESRRSVNLASERATIRYRPGLVAAGRADRQYRSGGVLTASSPTIAVTRRRSGGKLAAQQARTASLLDHLPPASPCHWQRRC